MPLTDIRVRNLKPKAKPYKLADGEGLYIDVSTAGSKTWRLAYRYDGKQKSLTIGDYPDVGLQEAREFRVAAKGELRAGRNPEKLVKKRGKVSDDKTFRFAAIEWIEKKKLGWAQGYSERMQARLDEDVLPQIGDMPIAEIKPPDVLAMIQRVEKRGAKEMARRILQMTGQIFRFGIATSRCESDPTYGLHEALEPPNPVKHRKPMPIKEMPQFFTRLNAYAGEPVTVFAIRLLLYTAVRTDEVRFAAKTEFEDLDGPKPLWRIPPQRMKIKKNRKEHLVPLAPQVVLLVKEIMKFSGKSPYLFPAATKSGVISENSMIFALYRMGYHSVATIHGFRTVASTMLNEHSWNPDWVEMQLAHIEKGVRGVYNAAEYLPGRRDMMKWWADQLDGFETQSLIG